MDKGHGLACLTTIYREMSLVFLERLKKNRNGYVFAY